MELKSFKKRTTTAIIFAVTTSTLILTSKFTFLLFCVISFVWLSIELRKIVTASNHSSNFYPVIFTGNLAIVISFLNAFYNISFYYFVLLTIPLYYLFILELLKAKENSLANISFTIFYFIYLLLPLIISIYLTSDILSINNHKNYSPLILFLSIVLIWIFDSMAYVFGILLGKHRLYEKVSPKKSWEGFIGGLIFTLAIGIIASSYFSELSLTDAIIISFIAGVFGTVGDLIESLFKRNIHIKDSGNTLPGHGGLLDRFDSFLFAIPWVFLYFLIKDLLKVF